jgi:hypothetical protein
LSIQSNSRRAFAIETYWPTTDGSGAARIEEEVHLTADGPRLLTRFPAGELLVTGRQYWNGFGERALGTNAIIPPNPADANLQPHTSQVL